MEVVLIDLVSIDFDMYLDFKQKSGVCIHM